jgi:hypothetical protein
MSTGTAFIVPGIDPAVSISHAEVSSMGPLGIIALENKSEQEEIGSETKCDGVERELLYTYEEAVV